MAKSRAWNPSPADRIGWDHPFIHLTQTAPGYLVQEMFGYADSTWEAWLLDNKPLWVSRNRRPWVCLPLLGRTSDSVEG